MSSRRAETGDVLTSEDRLYEELYDVRREAQEVGNVLDADLHQLITEARSRGEVQKGYLREVLGQPAYLRHISAADKPGYTCFSHAACEAVLRDAETFSSRVYHQGTGEGHPLGIIEMDGQAHRTCRRAIQPRFQGARNLDWWRERWIEGIVGALIDRLGRRATADLNLDVCARVPVHTVTRAIGMEGNESLVFREALMKSTLSTSASPQQKIASAKLVEDMLYSLIADRRKERQDDLVSFLIDAVIEEGGSTRRFTDTEIMQQARLVMVAGGGTSWRQFGTVLFALLSDPEQMAMIKADRSLIPAAIQESVRWSPTITLLSRYVARDCELDGVQLPAGSIIEASLSGANRDPSRYEDPHRFDLRRKSQGHLGFGIGSHVCLGRNVAATELTVGLNALLDTFPRMRLDPDFPAPYLTGGVEQQGVSSLKVRLD